MSDQLKSALIEVRKAYALLENYQQRVIELVDFVREELGARHNSQQYYAGNPGQLDGIYSDSNSGRKFLPLLDMSFLWLSSESEANDLRGHQIGDLLIDARVCSNTENSWPNFEGGSSENGNTELRLYVLQCITPVSIGHRWYKDVWEYIPYDQFKTLIDCPKNEGKYQMYAESFDLAELGDERAVRDAMSGFKKRVMEAFRPKCPVNRFELR